MWGWSKKLKCQLVHLFGTMVRSVEWQQEAQTKKKSLTLFLKIYHMSNRINTNASGSGWWWVAGK